MKSLGGGNLTVDRSQIIEVTDKKIVVKEATVPDKVVVRSAAPAQ